MAVWGGQKGEVEVSMGQKELHESRKYDDDKNKEDFELKVSEEVVKAHADQCEKKARLDRCDKKGVGVDSPTQNKKDNQEVGSVGPTVSFTLSQIEHGGLNMEQKHHEKGSTLLGNDLIGLLGDEGVLSEIRIWALKL